MTVPVKVSARGEIMESVLMKGDLAKLTPEERTSYYLRLCESIGLNPLTKPMEYITLNGRLTLYAKRDCTDQLRKINKISVNIISKEYADGLFSVHVKATDLDNRVDEDLGVVALPETLKGEARANTEMKAITKAKRRVTLSICGLGFLDETEIEDIPAARRPTKPAPNVMQPYDEQTGEIIDEKPSSPPLQQPTAPTKEPAAGPSAPSLTAAGTLSIEDMAREAASRGEPVFKKFYNDKSRTDAERKLINAIGDELRGLMQEAAP